MKTSIVLALSVIFLSTASAQDLCTQKKKQFGKRFISCETVDWGIQPLSADYQPENSSPMTALPGEVKNLKTGEYDYQNAYPGIAGTQTYFEGSFYGDKNKKGLPLAAKFASAVAAKEGSGSDFVQWLSTDWYNGLQQKQGAIGWEGKCEEWAAWSMDPQLQKAFSQIRDGLMCNGIPFTRGELKEIVTALYSKPYITDRKSLQAFYSGYRGQQVAQVEDANVALSKLGLLGGGDFRPDQVVDMARTSKASGRNWMMDKDAGVEIWNQPVKRVIDVAYDDQAVSEWEMLSVSDFEPVDQSGIFQQLSVIEKDFAVGLVQGTGISESASCTRGILPEAICRGWKGLSLTEQVAQFNQMKKAALEKNQVRFKRDLVLVKHELTIEYGEENSFASMKPDQTKTQVVSYVAVHSADANGNTGPLLRSQWAPDTRKMSEICKDQNFRDRVVSSLARPIDPDQTCADLKKGSKDFEVFVSALPPQTFKEFEATAYFRGPQAEQKQKAYTKFLEFMAGCQKFDEAAQFLRDLDHAVLDNVISEDEAKKLMGAYPRVKGMIDRGWLSEFLNQKQSVQGLPALKRQLLSDEVR